MTQRLDPNSLLSPSALSGAAQWTRMPYADAPRFGASDLQTRWPRLHAGQGLPPFVQGPLAEGWALYHSGEFERAVALALAHGSAGLSLANQATAVYAKYLEPP